MNEEPTSPSEQQNEVEPHSQEVELQQTLGQYLAGLRDAKKLSIKVLAQRTKISTTNLSALESDNYQALPKKAYLVGFVKSYIKIVGGSESEALQLLDHALGRDKTEEVEIQNLKKLSPGEAKMATPSSQTQESFPLGKVVLGALAILVIALIAVFLNSNSTPTLTEEPAKPVEPQSLGAETPLRQPSPEVVETEVPSETLTTEQIEYSPAQASVVTPVDVPETQAPAPEKLDITFRDIIAPMYQIAPLTQEEFDEYYPRDQRAPLIDGQQVVFVNAHEADTWITYKVDNEEIRRFVLSEGRSLIIRGEVIRMFLGNVNATRIFINNQLIDPMSRTGVKSLVFPDEARTNYKLPLFVYPSDGLVLTSQEYLESLED